MPAITARSLSGDTIWYRYLYGNNASSASSATSGIGDIVPIQSDEYGSLFTLPWVYNDWVRKTYHDIGDVIEALDPEDPGYAEDLAALEEELSYYADWHMPLMSYDPLGTLAVDLPFYGDWETGHLNVNIANIDTSDIISTSPPVHDEYESETILAMGDHYDANVSTSAPVVTVDVGHHAIHNSECYVATHVLTAAGVGGKINIYIKTPSIVSEQTMIHVCPRWSCKDITRFTIWEAHTYVTSGTGTGNNWSWNKNLYEGAGVTSLCVDNSAPTPLSGCYSRDVTINGGGNPIIQYSVGPKPIGGSDRDVDEWILNPSEPYVFELESLVDNNFLYLELVWYEHTTTFSA